MAELQTVDKAQENMEQMAAQANASESPRESFAGPNIKRDSAAKSPAGSKRMIMIAIAVAAVVSMGLLAMMFFKPKYQTLYAGLDQSDAAAISSYLEKNNIKFKISETGESITVTNVSVPKLRLELAGKGMPKGSGVGFEIFDKTNLTVTDFSQKLNYKRALEGELSRTISSLDSVKSAKVHLALAKKSVFKQKQEDSTASVVITPVFNQELSVDQVKGIRHLVASAINELEPENVQITDITGKSLVSSLDDEGAKVSKKNKQNQTKLEEYENDLETSLQSMLSPILGDENVLVNVKAEMNFDESEVDIELFSPVTDGNKYEPVVRSEKVVSENYNKKNASAAGIPGTQNNIPSFVGVNKSDADDKDYQREDKTRNYEVSRSVERIKKATGKVNKVSVAVVVNKDLNPSERATLRETVIVAAGLDMDRGDQVAITGIRFSSAPHLNRESKRQEKEQMAMEKKAQIKKYIALIVSIFVAAIAIGLLLLSLKAPIDSNQARKLEELLTEEEIPLLNSINEKLKEAEDAFHRKLSTEGKPTLTQMKRDLSKLAFEDPEKVARGLKAYVQEQ